MLHGQTCVGHLSMQVCMLLSKQQTTVLTVVEQLIQQCGDMRMASRMPACQGLTDITYTDVEIMQPIPAPGTCTKYQGTLVT
jgi:hypothetical protein